MTKCTLVSPRTKPLVLTALLLPRIWPSRIVRVRLKLLLLSWRSLRHRATKHFKLKPSFQRTEGPKPNPRRPTTPNVCAGCPTMRRGRRAPVKVSSTKVHDRQKSPSLLQFQTIVSHRFVPVFFARFSRQPFMRWLHHECEPSSVGLLDRKTRSQTAGMIRERQRDLRCRL